MSASRAAGSLSRVVTTLRDSVGVSDGRLAAWSVDASQHVSALRALEKQLKTAELALESETVAMAAATAPDFRQTSKAERAQATMMQRRFEMLLTELEGKDKLVLTLSASEHQLQTALASADRVANERTKKAEKSEKALAAAKTGRADAEARLAAAEEELAGLKIAHDELQYHAKLASYMRAAPGLRNAPRQGAGAIPPLPMPPAELRAQMSDPTWDGLLELAISTKPHEVLAAALHTPFETARAAKRHEADSAVGDVGGDADDGPGGLDVVTFLCERLQSRNDVAELLCTPAVADALVDAVWREVGRIQIKRAMHS